MAKTWLITGSSRGFGRELTRAALSAGDNVVATARDPRQLSDVEDAFPDRVRTVALDVTDADAARAAVRVATTAFGGLDVVVNNAGYGNSAAIEETPIEDFRAQIETNLFGVVNVTQAALPVLRRQRSGHFIQFSSIGGRVGGTPGMAAYQSAKFAVEGFSEVLNNEVGPFGVKVTIVEPGGFRTEWGSTSMHRAEVEHAEYEPSVGAMNRFRESTVDTWAGDPARAAAIILDVARRERPPLRLLLGAGAVEAAAKASLARAAEAEEWAEISRSADFPPDQG
ncbi:oxidoreductase [Streptomyces sp. SL13]|uniref:Oxidoreductase n=1 Tax=Streptantibioticus silvisoli TaxID=2705255 RepID=A0AA90H7A1_9ACTN|nr:oxidoreductase [Streptantibioticus silvisoli]MDI5973236.1 oxidoreductase [Streptantibioticus silvisoli]